MTINHRNLGIDKDEQIKAIKRELDYVVKLAQNMGLKIRIKQRPMGYETGCILKFEDACEFVVE